MRPVSQRQLDQFASRALSRINLRRKKTRLLCQSCQTLRLVVDAKPLAKEQVMECGHTRSAT